MKNQEIRSVEKPLIFEQQLQKRLDAFLKENGFDFATFLVELVTKELDEKGFSFEEKQKEIVPEVIEPIIEEAPELPVKQTIAVDQKVFQQNFKYLLDTYGMTRKDISDVLNVSYQTAVNWARGVNYPREETLDAMSEFFHIPVEDLKEKPLYK